MKKILISAAIGLATTAGAFAQGQLTVANFFGAGNAANAIITDTSSAGLSGTTYYADVFYGAVGTANSALTDLGVAIPFHVGAGAGYLVSTGEILPSSSGNVEVELRVWQSAAGASWAAATGGGLGTVATYQGHGGTQWGIGNSFTINAPVSPTPAPSWAGLVTPLQLTPVVPVPEPTTLALGGLGAAALLLFRRRK